MLTTLFLSLLKSIILGKTVFCIIRYIQDPTMLSATITLVQVIFIITCWIIVMLLPDVSIYSSPSQQYFLNTVAELSLLQTKTVPRYFSIRSPVVAPTMV